MSWLVIKPGRQQEIEWKVETSVHRPMLDTLEPTDVDTLKG